jgi:hypothetical protein
MDDMQAELHLAPAASILTIVLDHLQDALYRAEKLDQSHGAEDLRVNRILAGV